jgi:hypothetical protein
VLCADRELLCPLCYQPLTLEQPAAADSLRWLCPEGDTWPLGLLLTPVAPPSGPVSPTT